MLCWPKSRLGSLFGMPKMPVDSRRLHQHLLQQRSDIPEVFGALRFPGPLERHRLSCDYPAVRRPVLAIVVATSSACAALLGADDVEYRAAGSDGAAPSDAGTDVLDAAFADGDVLDAGFADNALPAL